MRKAKRAPAYAEDFPSLVRLIKPESTIALHSGCAEPSRLVAGLVAHASELRRVRLVTFMPMGPAPYAAKELSEHFRLTTFYPGKGLRKAVADGRVELMRQPLSAIPALFEQRKLAVDILFLRVSPPDEHGQMSLGISVDYMHSILGQTPVVMAEIDPCMPRTCGNTIIRSEQIDYILDSDSPPQTLPPETPGEVDRAIARNVAGLLRHGSVIQTGIGSIPDLVLLQLGHLRNLGIHTGIVTDAMMPLLKSGAITNATKSEFTGKCVATIAAGTQPFYDFLHRNADIEFHPCSFTHDRALLASINNLCAVNSVLEIDLSGRANAEQIGSRVIACPGGLPDFAAGASESRGGMSIIALRSTSPNGERSNVRSELELNVPVTVCAPHIDFVVTEFGAAHIRHLSPADRAKALIQIAHPEYRSELKRTAVA